VYCLQLYSLKQVTILNGNQNRWYSHIKGYGWILTADLDGKAALNGSFELNGSAAGGFGFVLLNGSETRYTASIITPTSKYLRNS
jgi:hypothetical protein